MYQLSHLLKPLSLGLLLGLASCDKQESSMPVLPTPGAHPAHLAFMTSVPNTSGIPSACYLVTTRDLSGGTYTNHDALPLELGNMPYYRDGIFYTFPSPLGSKTNEIGLYDHASEGQFARVGTIALKGGAGPVSIVCPSAEKGYMADWTTNKLLLFNPTTKALTGELDLSSYAQAGASVRPSILLERDGILFVPLNQIDPQWAPVMPDRCDILLVDTKTDKPIKVITDTKHGLSFPTRPFDSNSIFTDESGDIYVNCLGTFEKMLPDSHTGILRIKKGSTDFDPDYAIRLKDTPVTGLALKDAHATYLAGVCYVGQGKLLAFAGIPAIDPDFAKNPYGSHIHVLVSIDLAKGTISAVPGLTPSSIQAYGLGYDGTRFAYISHADKQSQGIYRYDVRAGKFDPSTVFYKVEGNVAGISYIPAR